MNFSVICAATVDILCLIVPNLLCRVHAGPMGGILYKI